MKKLVYFLLCIFFFTACDKDDDQGSQDPIEQLPKATQTGANTVGCLVNGEAFLPKGGGLAGNKNCFYQYVDGGYHFKMGFSDFSGDTSYSVVVGTQNASIEEGETYLLNSQPFFTNNIDGRGGGHSISGPSGFEKYTTTSEVTGEMRITKLDFENHIVSGTFWFDAVNEDGEVVEIREGRFDMNFTE